MTSVARYLAHRLDALLYDEMDKPEGSSMTRVALYARYSSDQQREASIEDQLRLCRVYAEKQG